MATPSSATYGKLSSHHELRNRTKAFALRIIALCDVLPSKPSGRVIGNQLLRSSTSVAANYRAAGRARSKTEFIAKLGIAIEEADESVFWLEPLIDAGIVTEKRLGSLLDEANQLLAILAASRHTAKSGR